MYKSYSFKVKTREPAMKLPLNLLEVYEIVYPVRGRTQLRSYFCFIFLRVIRMELY